MRKHKFLYSAIVKSAEKKIKLLGNDTLCFVFSDKWKFHIFTFLV